MVLSLLRRKAARRQRRAGTPSGAKGIPTAREKDTQYETWLNGTGTTLLGGQDSSFVKNADIENNELGLCRVHLIEFGGFRYGNLYKVR